MSVFGTVGEKSAMNHTEELQQTKDKTAVEPSAEYRQQVATPPCPTCGVVTGGGQAALNFVYAVGRIELRFPRLSVEKELAQATGRDETTGLTDREALHAVLSKRENRYLA